MIVPKCVNLSTATGKLKQQQQKKVIKTSDVIHWEKNIYIWSNVQCCKDNPVKFSDPVPNSRVSQVLKIFRSVLRTLQYHIHVSSR